MTEYRTITIAASGTLTIAAKGKVFACISASAEFQVRLGGGSPLKSNAGRKYGSAASTSQFNSLTFVETSGSSNTIAFAFGNEDITVETAASTTVATAITNVIATCVAATALQFLKTSTAAAVPVALTAAQTYFRKAILYGVNTLAGVNNTGDVNIGPSATASQQPIIITPGGEYVLEPPNGAKWNFQDWYLDVGTNGDGVVVIYT